MSEGLDVNQFKGLSIKVGILRTLSSFPFCILREFLSNFSNSI